MHDSRFIELANSVRWTDHYARTPMEFFSEIGFHCGEIWGEDVDNDFKCEVFEHIEKEYRARRISERN